MRGDLAHLPDEELVERLARSDENALAELYDRYGGVAYRLALRILRDPDLAEDAVQEGFLDAWRRATSYDPKRAKVSTWLLMIVHRRAVDLVRRTERWRTEALESLAFLGPPPADEAAELDELRGAVRRALHELPPEQREVIALAYYAGLTLSAIAECTGQPIGTVKSRLSAGLKKLRKALGDELESP